MGVFDKAPFNEFPQIWYNKGPKRYESNERRTVIPLPNVGRCDHTFLHHIVTQYDNHARVTVFLPASCMDAHKATATLELIALVKKTRNTVLTGTLSRNVRDEMYDFRLDDWRASNPKNSALNSESKLEPASIRPFGAWYDAHFGNDVAHVICYNGIFAVAREHIIQHPKSRYETLVEQLSHHSNPEVGHYTERSWAALFQPYPPECVYKRT